MPLTYKAANAYLNHLVGAQSAYVWKTYLGLSTTAPNRDGSGYTEPGADTGYARVSFGGAGIETSSMDGASMGAISNKSTIFFPEAMKSWGKITYYLIFDKEEGGDLLAYGPLDDPISPEKGKVPIIRTGNLTMTMR